MVGTYGSSNWAIAKADATTVAAPPTSVRQIIVMISRWQKTYPYRLSSISCPVKDIIRIRSRNVMRQRLTAPGFKLIPPESNVIPLPTNARG